MIKLDLAGEFLSRLEPKLECVDMGLIDPFFAFDGFDQRLERRLGRVAVEEPNPRAKRL